MAARALSAYAVGLIGMSLVKILATAAFARQDTVTPVRAGVVAVAVNMVLSLILARFMAHAGLAAATACAAFVNAALVYRRLVRGDAYRPLPGWTRLAWQLLLATGVMALVVWRASPPLPIWVEWGPVQRASGCVALIGAGVLAYALTLRASGLRFEHVRGPQS
jgi:putative peptidoglycan lipid II flippase